MDFLSRAEIDLAEIDRKLAELVPLQQRREQLRAFIAMGRNLFGGAVDSANAQDLSDATVVPRTVIAVGRAGSAKARILDTAAAVIAAEGPMPTRSLLDRLEAQGIEIGGSDKLVTVSVIMSRAKDRFKSDRAVGGWSLLTPSHEEKTPQGAPTPAGS